MKIIILFFLLAGCTKAEVKPVSVVTTVDNVGIDSTVATIDKPRKKGHEWGPK